MLSRQKIVFRIELEAPEIDRHPDMLGGFGHPGHKDDEEDKQDMPDSCRLHVRQRRNGRPEGKGGHQHGKPYNPLQARDERAPEEILVLDQAGQQAKENAMRKERQRDDDCEDDDARKPVRQPDAFSTDIVKKLCHAVAVRVRCSMGKEK